jgi:hypothetical protein
MMNLSAQDMQKIAELQNLGLFSDFQTHVSQVENNMQNLQSGIKNLNMDLSSLHNQEALAMEFSENSMIVPI